MEDKRKFSEKKPQDFRNSLSELSADETYELARYFKNSFVANGRMMKNGHPNKWPAHKHSNWTYLKDYMKSDEFKQRKLEDKEAKKIKQDQRKKAEKEKAIEAIRRAHKLRKFTFTLYVKGLKPLTVAPYQNWSEIELITSSAPDLVKMPSNDKSDWFDNSKYDLEDGETFVVRNSNIVGIRADFERLDHLRNSLLILGAANLSGEVYESAYMTVEKENSNGTKENV